MASCSRLQQAYSQMQKRRDELDRQLQGEEPTFGLMGSAEGTPIDGQIARFKAQRDQLLLQYTEKHPQVQSLNETIAGLEAEKRAGAKISSSVAAPGANLSSDQGLVRSLDMNPVYQNLRLQLSQADADLAAIRGQMEAQQRLVADLRSRVNDGAGGRGRAVPAESRLRGEQAPVRHAARSDSSPRRSRSQPNRTPRTSSSASSSRRPCRSSRAARIARVLNSLVLLAVAGGWPGPGDALRPDCTRRSRRVTCCRKSPEFRLSDPSRRPCARRSSPGIGSQPVMVGGAVGLLLAGVSAQRRADRTDSLDLARCRWLRNPIHEHRRTSTSEGAGKGRQEAAITPVGVASDAGGRRRSGPAVGISRF